MNKNFKQVMDLIAEMKQSFKRSTTNFEQAALTDGTIVEFETLEVGQAVFVVTETETIPAPEGTHALSGELEGVSIIVDANGIITEIIDERATTEETSAQFEAIGTEALPAILESVSEIIAEKLSVEMDIAFDIASQIVAKINEMATETPVAEETSAENMSTEIIAKLDTFNATFEDVVKMFNSIASENKNLSKQIGSLKGQFETFKSAPTNNTNEGEKIAKVGNLTAKQQWLKYNKNK